MKNEHTASLSLQAPLQSLLQVAKLIFFQVGFQQARPSLVSIRISEKKHVEVAIFPLLVV